MKISRRHTHHHTEYLIKVARVIWLDELYLHLLTTPAYLTDTS